jgi:hypothetical protein
MGALTYGSAWQTSDAYMVWPNDEEDDVAAVQFWLWRNLGRDAGPYIFPARLEGTFQLRPAAGAITITTLPVTNVARNRARTPSYVERTQLALAVYGADTDDRDSRAETVALSRRVWRLFMEGEPGCPPFRIPMYLRHARTRVAGNLRVMPDSLTMGLDETNDEGQWRRTVDVALEAPRMRDTTPTPTVDTIVLTQR